MEKAFDKTINELNSRVRECDEEITRLKGRIEDSSDNISHLNDQIKKKDEEITTLKSHIEAAGDNQAGDFQPSDKRAPVEENPQQQERGDALSPDIYLIGNSLTGDMIPGKLFSPKYTKIKTLPNKNLDGALEFISSDAVVDIKPKTVILHCLENDISKYSGENVLKKMSKVIDKCKSVFPNASVMVVEPIGRGRNEENYNKSATFVRNNLNKYVPEDMIIKTKPLHKYNTDLFSSDQVHLKPAGLSQLIIAYKKHVYPKLGLGEYVEPNKRDGASADGSFADRRTYQRGGNRRRNHDSSPSYGRGGNGRRNYDSSPHDDRSDRIDKVVNMFATMMKEFK